MSGAFDPTLEAVSLGTTILAATYKGGVILAADTRTSAGNYIGNRAADKITPLSDRVYACRSGSAADTQAVVSYVQYFIAQHQVEQNDEVDVKTAATLAMSLLYNNKDKMQAGMIVAGWDKQNGGSVYALPLGGTMLKVPFTTGGSGSTYIFGYCDKNWRPEMSEEECQNLVVRAVGYAIARDASSGGNVRMVTINDKGVSRVFIPGTDVPVGYGELSLSSQPRP